MSGPQQALLARSNAAANIGGTFDLEAAFATTNTTSSASYVDVTTGGVPITAVITKSAGTNVLVYGGIGVSTAGTPVVKLGVNDGTTDWDIACRAGNSTYETKTAGTTLITGLGAGTFTFTLRFKSNSVSFGTGSSDNFFIHALEVGT